MAAFTYRKELHRGKPSWPVYKNGQIVVRCSNASEARRFCKAMEAKPKK